MKVYKATDKNMRCRGYQFEIGKTAVEDKAELCSKGFHACEAPLDILGYYAPGDGSRYFEAELEEVSPQRHSEDTKVVGKKITLGAELNIPALCKAHFEYVKEHTTMEHTDPKQATAGYRGAATAGESGAATSRGSVTVGKNGCGLVRGNGVKVRGGLGAVLVICVENKDDLDIKECKMLTIDGETYKPDTWYTLKDGEIVEVE